MLPIFGAMLAKKAKEKFGKHADKIESAQQQDPLQMDQMDPEMMDYDNWRDEYTSVDSPARNRLRSKSIYGRFGR